MKRAGLQKAVSEYEGLFRSFEKIIEVAGRLPIGDNGLACSLCELYALMGAFEIRAYIDAIDEVRGAFDAERRGRQINARQKLPKYEAVKNASQGLFLALASKDKTGVSAALEEMGVLAICPAPEERFSRIENILACFVGRSQLIPLTELAFFAAECGDYENAVKYCGKARSFDPTSWELYKLCMTEGLIALNAGKTKDAIQCMDRSMRACEVNEYDSLYCSVRGPIFLLVEELLQRDERFEVLKHLADCGNVWQSLRPQFDAWISTIESGKRPDFLDSQVLKLGQLSYRLKTQWLSACCLVLGSSSVNPKSSVRRSPAQVLAGRERLKAEHDRHMDNLVKKAIRYLDE